MDNYEHIHTASDKRLAEMLIFVADHYSRLMTHDENETLRESAHRLAAYQHHEPEESGCEVNFTTKSEDLEEVAYNYAQQHNELLGFDCDCEPIQTGPELKKAVIFGAEWQEQQMKEALQTEYEKGRFDMIEEMIKNAVLETKVIMDCDGDGIETPYAEWLTLEDTEIPYIPDNLGLKEGDKVKVVVLKTK